MAGIPPYRPPVTCSFISAPGGWTCASSCAAQLTKRLVGRAEVVDEVHGFKYFDERDLLGFVDGTENPTGAAAFDAASIGDEDPAFAGGSYVIVQKYLHDLRAGTRSRSRSRSG